MVRVFVRELRRYPADLIIYEQFLALAKNVILLQKERYKKHALKLLLYCCGNTRALLCLCFAFTSVSLFLSLNVFSDHTGMCIIIFHGMKKKTFLSQEGKKAGKFVWILQSDVDKLRTHTRALDDDEEEVKEEEELEDVLHHHQNCRSYSFFASKRER